MSQATTTKLYTRDEVMKLSHEAIARAMRRTLRVLGDGDTDPTLVAAFGLAFVKMAATADQKLEKLLDKAEGKK